LLAPPLLLLRDAAATAGFTPTPLLLMLTDAPAFVFSTLVPLLLVLADVAARCSANTCFDVVDTCTGSPDETS